MLTEFDMDSVVDSCFAVDSVAGLFAAADRDYLVGFVDVVIVDMDFYCLPHFDLCSEAVDCPNYWMNQSCLRVLAAGIDYALDHYFAYYHFLWQQRIDWVFLVLIPSAFLVLVVSPEKANWKSK